MEKTRHVTIAFLLALAVLAPVVQAKSPTLLLREGIYAEETEGDLDKAIGLYEQVLEEYREVERLGARATYQLGMCYLKKGEKEKAAEYFQKTVTEFAGQKQVVKKADEQLKKIKPETKESVFEQIDYQVTRFLGEQFGETAIEAGQKNLSVNSHIYYVDLDGFRYQGGMNAFYNWTGRTITQKVRFGGTSYQNQTHYGVDGHELNTEIVPDKTRPNHWQIYWIPDEPLAPEEHLYYGWSMNSKRKTSKLPGDVYSLTMDNKYGQPVIETFFLVLPKDLKISKSNSPTGSQELLNFNVYWWTKTVQQGEGHTEWVNIEYKLAIGNVITTIEGFLRALIAGNTTEAMQLVTAHSAVAHQLEDFTEIPNYETIQIANVYADNKIAFAITDVIFTDNGQDSLLTFTLIKQRGLWMVDDIDMETSEKAEADIQAFLKRYPTARPVSISVTSKTDRLLAEELAAAGWQQKQYQISDNTFLDLDSGALISPNKDVPNEYDVGWDNDGGGALMVNPKKPAPMVGLSGVEKGKRGEAIKAAEKSLELLRKSPSKGVLAEQAAFCAVLTDKGNLVVIEISEYSPQKATLNVWMKEKNANIRTEVNKANKLLAEELAAVGWKLWGQRKLTEAEGKFKEAIAKNPEADGAYQGLGWAQLNQGKKLNAKDSFEKCVKLNPKNSAALNGLGWIAHGQGNIDEAISWWEKAIEAQPGTTAALNGLTQVYMEKKEYDKAIKYYQMWLKAEPNNKQVKEGLKKARASNRN